MDISAQLAQQHLAGLHAQAAAHRLATEARRPRELRARLGWTLVEVGLRLAAPSGPKPALA
ncbi:hypothetical protein [Streptomyces sp. NPDC006739]|uniref:hypothetical protein n=1 Tax=Streptomyces sp. NPDC006739 TaxID=3364763 RepID=UPI003675E3F8